MPELPEVETTVMDLQPHVVGRSFVDVEVRVPRMVRAPDPEGLRRGLGGRRIAGIRRRGKYIVFCLDRGALVAHLMMGGALRWSPSTAVEKGEAPPAYTRFRFRLDDGSELWLVNPRTLGGVWLVEDPEQVVGHLGPEPLAPEFTPEVLATRLKGRAAPIKPLLLDQSVVAGIGNIYADEALFLAGIRPDRAASDLSAEEVRDLHGSIQAALRKGLALRGTSLGDFFDPFGETGSHQLELNVFRRQGQPCPRCGTLVQRTMFRGRGTHFCPLCQR